MTRTTILFLAFAMAAGCGSSSTTDAGTDVATATDTGTHTDAATGTDVVVATDTPQATDTAPADVVTATDATSSTSGTLMGTAQNYADGTGLNGLTVMSCAASDTMCASPFGMATTSATGTFMLTYPLTAGAFNGYLQFTGGSATSAVTPTRLFVNFSSAAVTSNFALVPQATFTGLAGLFSAQFDATHGAVTFAVYNSLGDGVAGAQVSATPSAGTEFYIMTSVPSETATMTDVSGEGGFFSTAPGSYTFTVTLPSASDAGTVPRTTVTASVVGNFITAFSF